VICILLGLMKAGILANMLAEPVIVGFTFAAISRIDRARAHSADV